MSDGFEADIEILNQIIQEAQEVRNATSKAKLVREIVPIERWLFDEYYIGKSGMHLYDYWRKVMVEIFGVRKGLINEVIVTGGLGCRPIKGTTYDTNHGKLTMSDIKELIKTQIVTINSPLGDTTIIDVHNVGNKPCNSILFNNGYHMVATTDHSFWVIDNSNYIWKELKDIQVGDKLPYYDESTNKWTSVTVCSNEPYGTIECGDIEVDGHIYINKGLVQHNTGKSTFGLYCLLRKIYELSCYENVANLFKLMPNSILMLIYFSVSKDQAELTGYGQLRNIIDEIEYFRENFPRDDKIDSLLRFPENVLVRAGSDTSHCLDPESFIYTDKGIIRAKKLDNTYKVWNGNSFKQVISTYTTTGIMYKVKTDTGREIIVKDNHKNYTTRGFVETKDLIVGDVMMRATGYSYSKENSTIEVPKFSNDRRPLKFNIKLDTKFYEILGWAVGDGSTVDGRLRLYGATKELSILEDFKFTLSNYFDTNDVRNNSSSVISLELQSKSIDYILDKFDMKRRSVDKIIPSLIWEETQENQRAFLRGLFSADGSNKVRENGSARIRYVSISRKLVEEMQILLNSLGIECSYGKNGYPSNERYNRKQPYQLAIRAGSTKLFYDTIGFLGYKEEIYKPSERIGQNVYEKIVSIELLGEQYCCGAEVEDSIYTCNGLITHNSIGANLIGALLDEANFFQKGAQDPSKLVAAVGRISTLYTSIVNRASSRFKNKERDDSLCILISSNTTSSSFTDERIRKTVGQPNVLVINARLWEVKPKGTYSEDMFYVYAGSDFVDPFVINQIGDLLQLPDVSEVMLEDRTIEDVVKLLPVKEQELFVKVPQDFHKEFNNDVVQSLQDIAGMSVAPSGRLFSSKKVYKESCTDFYRHPFTSEQFIIQTQSPVKVADFVDPRYRPVYRERGRCIHIDQSTTNDSTGFASSFIEGYTNIDGITKPIVAVDLMVRINPPKPPYKISIPKTRDFIFYMRDKWGLPITCVSYDQFASAESRQVLSENGVTNEYLSVDRSDEQYLTFIEMLYEGRIKWYHYKPAEDELFNLIHFRDKKKVDHPIGGCFTGDTLVLLSDGSYKTIDELSKQKNQLVYGYRQDINKFISTNMTKGSLTKRTNTIIDVYIKANNIISKVSCTEDHKFLLDTGLYMPARVLEVGDRLKSIYKAYVYKVEVRHIPEGINVYDITVPETSNFIIHPGIVVHNSKDVMDAVVGSVWSTLQHNENVNSMNTAGDLDNIIDNMLLDDEDDEDDSWILEDYR